MVILNWVSSHLAIVGLILSEALALMPGVKSNSVIQLLVNLVKDLATQIASKLG